MKDTILMISPILALIISIITVFINLSIRGEDSFQKTLDLLNAHLEFKDDDRVINKFARDVVLRKIIRKQIARAYKPFSILSFTWLVIKFLFLSSSLLIFALLALSPSEMHWWERAMYGIFSLTITIILTYTIVSTLSSESVILDDNLETMIYAHYLTELGFKQKQYNHDLEGTKHKFSWIKVPIHWIKIRLQFFSIREASRHYSIREASRHYTQFIKTETQLKTLYNLNPHPVTSPLHYSWLEEHSWMKDRIAQTEQELRELREALTKKWPNEFDALKDWTKYTRSLEQESTDDISRSSQSRV